MTSDICYANPMMKIVKMLFPTEATCYSDAVVVCWPIGGHPVAGVEAGPFVAFLRSAAQSMVIPFLKSFGRVQI